jgi:Domain of unknown function (DUF6398)
MSDSRNAQTTAVPRAMLERYRELTALTDAFCRERLNEGYAELSRKAVAALCRKRPSPVTLGQAATWACGVIYALGQVNFLDDKSATPHMRMQEVCTGFGVAPSTGGNKAKAVRDLLRMGPWDHRWMLPDRVESTGLVWLLQIDGLTVDIRGMPRPVQVEACERGLIPYVPSDGSGRRGGTRELVLERYDGYRSISTVHQSALAARLWRGPIAEFAVRLGQIEAAPLVDEKDLDDLTCAADLAIYSDRATAASRYAEELNGTLADSERHVLYAMRGAYFSIFRVVGCHRGAGVDLTDLISGQRLWVVDRSLEATASAGTEVAMRLFKPDEFWMTTGVAVAMDRDLWQQLKDIGAVQRRQLPMPALDRDLLAETVYRLAGE